MDLKSTIDRILIYGAIMETLEFKLEEKVPTIKPYAVRFNGSEGLDIFIEIQQEAWFMFSKDNKEFANGKNPSDLTEYFLNKMNKEEAPKFILELLMILSRL